MKKMSNKKVVLYVHGKDGSCQEAENYRDSLAGFDVLGVDYAEYQPWVVEKQIQTLYDQLKDEYKQIDLLAVSIGAYFAMHALQHCPLHRALFVSPILDMEKLILTMMQWGNVTEQELQKQGEIPTDFGETLSWKYLTFVRNNPIHWEVPTEILYAQKDHLTPLETVEEFVKTHDAELTVMENGEHWFHTEEQVAFLNPWVKKAAAKVRTERLIIEPLSKDELSVLVERYRNTVLELSMAYQEMLDGCVHFPKDELWYTAWKVCLRDGVTEVGFAGFKGVKDGCVEIGYGVNEAYEGQGYATEVVRGLCEWALSMPRIVAVEAETEVENEASKRVLEKNGFLPTGKYGEEGPRYRKNGVNLCRLTLAAE